MITLQSSRGEVNFHDGTLSLKHVLVYIVNYVPCMKSLSNF